jgi:hypothetical protein
VIRDDDALRARVRDALDAVYQPAPGLLRRCVDAAERSQRRGTRVLAVAAATLAALVAVAVVVLTLVQHGHDRNNPGPVQTPRPGPAHLVYTVDAAGGVAALDAQTLRASWRASVGAFGSAGAPATLLQLSPDGRTLWVLALTDSRGGTTLRAFDAATGTAGASVQLSAQGNAAYHAIAVEPRSGDVYVVGQDATRILVTVVDPQRAAVLRTAATRSLPTAAPVGIDLPLDARFTADGSRLYYTYGSADTDRSGIDWVAVAGGALTPCTPAAPGAACIPGDDRGLALSGDHLLSLDGGNPQSVVELTADGQVVRRFATGLVGGAVRDVVVDTGRNIAAGVGACTALGGVMRVDLGGGTAQVVATPGAAGALPDPATPCGVRAHLLGDGTLVVSRLDAAQANPNSPGTVQVIDPATGRILREAALPAGVLDVLPGP